MTVYVGTDGDRGYVRFGERGPHLVVEPDGTVGHEFVERVEMFDPYVEVLEGEVEDALREQAGEVLGLLREQRLSRRLRVALAQALDAEVDDVGRAAS